MNASTPRREGDREMQQDVDLISPIQNIGERQETTKNESVTASDDGSPTAGTARTHLSDHLTSMNIGPRRNRHNNTSSEIWLEVLCLEETAIRRGIIQRNPRRLEWLDLITMASETTRNVRVDEWSTNSFNSKDGEVAEKILKPKDEEVDEKILKPEDGVVDEEILNPYDRATDEVLIEVLF